MGLILSAATRPVLARALVAAAGTVLVARALSDSGILEPRSARRVHRPMAEPGVNQGASRGE